MTTSSPESPESPESRKSFNWRSPQVAVLLGAVAVAAIAVPAWAKSDHGLDDELIAAGGPPGVTPRASGPIPPPPGEATAVLPAGSPAGARERGERIAPLPPPPGAPPGPGQLFPLSDEQIEQQRDALQKFVDCLRDHGQDVGDPEVGRFQIAIPVGDDAMSEEFQQAAEECGGPPPFQPPDEDESPQAP
ncbi:MAG TPA: hypothetical protein VEK39_02290 [Solirubrobacterales bacterium]|nr:hypothetical protein [Solirubrobacterales bacterium]